MLSSHHAELHERVGLVQDYKGRRGRLDGLDGKWICTFHVDKRRGLVPIVRAYRLKLRDTGSRCSPWGRCGSSGGESPHCSKH